MLKLLLYICFWPFILIFKIIQWIAIASAMDSLFDNLFKDW